MHYEVRYDSNIAFYDRDVLMPVPRLRVWREAEPLCVVDALLSTMTVMVLQQDSCLDQAGLRHALVRYVAGEIEMAINQGCLPTEPTLNAQRVAVMDGGPLPEGVQLAASVAGFRMFLRQSGASDPIDPGQTPIHQFDF